MNQIEDTAMDQLIRFVSDKSDARIRGVQQVTPNIGECDAVAAVLDQCPEARIVAVNLFSVAFAAGKSGSHRPQQAGTDAVLLPELFDPHWSWGVGDLHASRQLHR